MAMPVRRGLRELLVMRALIIIDQQKGIDHPKLGDRNNLRKVAMMLSLILNVGIPWLISSLVRQLFLPN